MEWPSAFLIALNGMTTEAYSARPDAPVVADTASTHRTDLIRLTMARILYRAAQGIAPAEHHPAYPRS